MHFLCSSPPHLLHHTHTPAQYALVSTIVNVLWSGHALCTFIKEANYKVVILQQGTSCTYINNFNSSFSLSVNIQGNEKAGPTAKSDLAKDYYILEFLTLISNHHLTISNMEKLFGGYSEQRQLTKFCTWIMVTSL